jgi:hypothetical protein
MKEKEKEWRKKENKGRRIIIRTKRKTRRKNLIFFLKDEATLKLFYKIIRNFKKMV